jgi:glycosyltransferase involved in cell wall biosynthesis
MAKGALFKKIFTNGPRPGYIKNYSQHLTLKNAGVLIALSHHEKNFLKRITNRNDIEIVPHWIDTNIVERPEKDFLETKFTRPFILFVGQLKYRRGFDIAVKIFARVKKENPRAALIVVTNNTDKKKELLDLAGRHGVGQSLILKENISEKEKFSLYKQADVYLSPTRYEGFGVTFLEAMASGCPVVASDIPVVREVVEGGKTGLLARLEDPYDFYKKIEKLLTDSALRENLIKNALKKIEIEYNKDRIFAKLLAIYERMIK